MSSSNTTGLRGMLVQLLQEGIIYSREAPRNLPKSQVYFDSVNEMDTIEFRSQFRVSRGKTRLEESIELHYYLII